VETNRFPSAREAKEFLVARIVEEAQREGVPLSEVERKELYFSEGYWTLPDMMDVNDEFDRECDANEYEKKIAKLIRSATRRARKDNHTEYDLWLKAIGRLRKEDHYILVMIDRANVGPRSRTGAWNHTFIFIGLMCVGIAFIAISNLGLRGPRPGQTFGSYTENESISKIAGYVWFALVIIWLSLSILTRLDRSHRLSKVGDQCFDKIVNLFRKRKT